MSWKYQIIRHDERHKGKGDVWYALHERYDLKEEAHYGLKEETLWTKYPTAVEADSPEGIIKTLNLMLDDATKDYERNNIIDYE